MTFDTFFPYDPDKRDHSLESKYQGSCIPSPHPHLTALYVPASTQSETPKTGRKACTFQLGSGTLTDVWCKLFLSTLAVIANSDQDFSASMKG